MTALLDPDRATPRVPSVPDAGGRLGGEPASGRPAATESGGGDLTGRVLSARARLVPQADAALYDALSDAEIDADIALAAWMRARRRDRRRREFGRDLAAADRDRRGAARVARELDGERRWHARARAAQRRATSSYALAARVHRQAVWSSWALRLMVCVGLAWSGVNVGRNLAPSGGPGPT